jgi:hypothetical protein
MTEWERGAIASHEDTMSEADCDRMERAAILLQDQIMDENRFNLVGPFVVECTNGSTYLSRHRREA